MASLYMPCLSYKDYDDIYKALLVTPLPAVRSYTLFTQRLSHDEESSLHTPQFTSV